MRGLNVMLGVILALVAIPILFIFQVMTATQAVFLTRETWYGVMAEPGIYESFIDEFEEILPESRSQREAVQAAISPVYVKNMLNRVVDYGFDVLEGKPVTPPVFEVPSALAEAVQRNPNAGSFDFVQMPNGAVGLTVDVPQSAVSQLRNFGVQFTLALVISATVGLLVWFIAGWLGAQTTRGRLIWLGVTLIFASFGVVMLGVTGLNSVIDGITTDLARTTSQTDMIQVGVTRGLLNVMPKFAQALIFAGGIPSAIGLVLIAMGAMLQPRRQLTPYRV